MGFQECFKNFENGSKLNESGQFDVNQVESEEGELCMTTTQTE